MQALDESKCLFHHGILGQKWGKKNGPPYPLSKSAHSTAEKKAGYQKSINKKYQDQANGGVIPAGTKLNSVSQTKDSNEYLKRNNKTLYTYNDEDKWDEKVYKGPFTMYKTNGAPAQYDRMGIKSATVIYEHKYETVKDLVTPTQKQRMDEFINLYKNEKHKTIKALSYVQQLYRSIPESSFGSSSMSKHARDMNLKKLNTQEDYEAAYELFNHAMEKHNSFASTKKYVEIMSTKYDAMMDDNNFKVYNEANSPVIIFDAYKNLKPVQSMPVSAIESVEDYKYVRKELSKKGKNVML